MSSPPAWVQETVVNFIRITVFKFRRLDRGREARWILLYGQISWSQGQAPGIRTKRAIYCHNSKKREFSLLILFITSNNKQLTAIAVILLIWKRCHDFWRHKWARMGFSIEIRYNLYAAMVVANFKIEVTHRSFDGFLGDCWNHFFRKRIF